MKYQILLEDRTNGRQALIECPANMPLEELSVKIKVELNLPLCDNGWHRFLYRGKVYVPDEHVIASQRSSGRVPASTTTVSAAVRESV